MNIQVIAVIIIVIVTVAASPIIIIMGVTSSFPTSAFVAGEEQQGKYLL